MANTLGFILALCVVYWVSISVCEVADCGTELEFESGGNGAPIIPGGCGRVWTFDGANENITDAVVVCGRGNVGGALSLNGTACASTRLLDGVIDNVVFVRKIVSAREIGLLSGQLSDVTIPSPPLSSTTLSHTSTSALAATKIAFATTHTAAVSSTTTSSVCASRCQCRHCSHSCI
eukprot:TRINITY_DN1813_c0_g1_i1.p1 TRINITY_DN1813_c0_g1~~TRINITY_DN1813_c0_g1_i1.p1  ORF type:complete len:177 (+),score=11.60 TRINITY_DN1813_c0_g1_i1:70-600(+)